MLAARLERWLRTAELGLVGDRLRTEDIHTTASGCCDTGGEGKEAGGAVGAGEGGEGQQSRGGRFWCEGGRG